MLPFFIFFDLLHQNRRARTQAKNGVMPVQGCPSVRISEEAGTMIETVEALRHGGGVPRGSCGSAQRRVRDEQRSEPWENSSPVLA